MLKTAFALTLLASSVGWCQTPTRDPDTTQTLLTEVHQLRLAIEGMTVASQRVQIALYALQIQDAAVARAEQRVDSARSKCASMDENRRRMTQNATADGNCVRDAGQ